MATLTVALLDTRKVSLVFDQFPEETITVKEIKDVLAEALQQPARSLHMVRTFPTLSTLVLP